MTKSFATSLIRWWCHQEEGDFASHIAEDFIYDNGLETVTREDFLLIRAGSGTMVDIRIIDVQCGGDADAVMFEATDVVTALRHRICWMMTYERDRVARVVTCSGVVPKPEDKPILSG